MNRWHMELGFLGLGQMGAAIAERLEADDVRLHVFDPNPVAVAPFVLRGAVDAGIGRAVAAAAPIVFACLPNGAVSESTASEAAAGIDPSDLRGDVNYRQRSAWHISRSCWRGEMSR